jgi:thiosulfate reductase cytochrome b subunit
VTGFAIWKPVQLGWITDLFGGFPIARGIHLAAMIGIVLFLVVHLTLVAIFPRTLVAMVVGIEAEQAMSGVEVEPETAMGTRTKPEEVAP